ncbi:MAG: hypothetical protein AAB739_02675 [Patescibacteria group bacterium]
MIRLNTPYVPDAAEKILKATSLNDFARRWDEVTRDIPSKFEQGFSGAVVDYIITTGRQLDEFLSSLPAS